MITRVADGWPTLKQHWIYVSCFIGRTITIDLTQPTRYIIPTLIYCWAIVCDAGPTVNQRWDNVSYLIGSYQDAEPTSESMATLPI